MENICVDSNFASNNLEFNYISLNKYLYNYINKVWTI